MRKLKSISLRVSLSRFLNHMAMGLLEGVGRHQLRVGTSEDELQHDSDLDIKQADCLELSDIEYTAKLCTRLVRVFLHQ